MKNILIILSFFLLFSCENNNPNLLEEEIIGEWAIVEFDFGDGLKDINDNELYVSFKKDGKFSAFIAGDHSGTYKVFDNVVKCIGSTENDFYPTDITSEIVHFKIHYKIHDAKYQFLAVKK